MTYSLEHYRLAFRAAADLGDIQLSTLMQAFDEFVALAETGIALRKLREPMLRVFPDTSWKFKPYSDALAFLGAKDTHTNHLDALVSMVLRKTSLLHKQAQFVEGDVPYLRFSAVCDARTPPNCLAKHGSIYRLNSQAWEKNHPLVCEFGECRCVLTAVFDFDFADNGWEALD
jgi:SPP1 gp7 family putative phage head morphogenesis protein